MYIATGTEYYSPTSAAGYFDIENKTWANIMTFPGTARNFATGWAINNSGYVGFGYNSSDDQRHYKDIYKYDPGSDNWSAIANPFPGDGKRSPLSFTVNGKAYVGGGFPLLGDYFPDLYEFDPDGETWTRKADLPEVYNTWIKACTVNNAIFEPAHFVMEAGMMLGIKQRAETEAGS